jgi:two-component system, LuxR family, response regulator FixJ
MRVSSSVIHLVDDDPGVRATLARLVISGGYSVRTYASGKELLDAADTLAGDCIILDIDMPDVDGFAVNRALADRSIDIPVVLMTGAGDHTVLALKAGVANFMQKPFGRDELLSVLHRLVPQRCVEGAAA